MTVMRIQSGCDETHSFAKDANEWGTRRVKARTPTRRKKRDEWGTPRLFVLVFRVMAGPPANPC
jgi:hypothetical protein